MSMPPLGPGQWPHPLGQWPHPPGDQWPYPPNGTGHYPPPPRNRRPWILAVAVLAVVAMAVMVGVLVAHRQPGRDGNVPAAAGPSTAPASSTVPAATTRPRSSTSAAPGQSVLPFDRKQLHYANEVRVDSRATVYVVGGPPPGVFKLPAGAQTSVATAARPTDQVTRMALDRDGNLYYTVGSFPTPDQLHPRGTLMKLALDAAAPTVVAPLPKENASSGLAVDSAGTVYVNVGRSVFRIAAGASAYAEIDLGMDLKDGPQPNDCEFAGRLAVGPSDDLYALCHMGSQVVRFAAGSMERAMKLDLPAGFTASDIAVDSGGTIYLTADPIYTGAGRLLRYLPGDTTPSDVPVTGLRQSDSVAVDGDDNVYVCDGLARQIIKLTFG